MPTSSKNGKRSLGRTGSKYLAAREKLKTISLICHVCGELIDLDITDSRDPMYFTADHLIPVSSLKRDDPALWDIKNLAPAHMKCNSSRGKGIVRVEHPSSRNWRE